MSTNLYDILKKENAETSGVVISLFKDDPKFKTASKEQTEIIIQRDNDDATKLVKGIEISLERGTLDPLNPKDYQEIDVLGKTPDEVVGEILNDVGDAVKTGSVIVLVGLSGTGKGTTVAKLAEKLPKCVTWSNGNIFRAFTLLSCEKSKKDFGVEFAPEVLSSENIISFTKMISFNNFPGRGFDIRISAPELGVEYFVNDVKNTVLKAAKINKNIPSVAEVTQGEAIMFAKQAIELMSRQGTNVLLEGRQQTVDFIDSEFRYCLKLSDMQEIGRRRVAQVVAASALAKLKADGNELSAEEALRLALEEF